MPFHRLIANSKGKCLFSKANWCCHWALSKLIGKLQNNGALYHRTQLWMRSFKGYRTMLTSNVKRRMTYYHTRQGLCKAKSSSVKKCSLESNTSNRLPKISNPLRSDLYLEANTKRNLRVLTHNLFAQQLLQHRLSNRKRDLIHQLITGTTR